MDTSENITVRNETEDRNDQEQPKYTTAASGGGANEENKEERKKVMANGSEACEKMWSVSTVREKEKVEKLVAERTGRAQDKQTVTNANRTDKMREDGKESNNESHTKENDFDQTGDIREKERKLGEKLKGAERATDCQDQTETTENTGEMKLNKNNAHDKQRSPAKIFGTSSDLRPSTTSSVCPRGARPSATRDAMAKFQNQAPGVENFRVQRTSIGMAGGASIKQKILQWCKTKTQRYEGVKIENFSSSWNDGLGFCALVHCFFPTAFDFSSLKASEREKNFTLAFSTAESLADCCPLLEVSDMLLMGNKPDPLCVFTYVQSLCHHLSKIDRDRKENTEDKNKDDQGLVNQ